MLEYSNSAWDAIPKYIYLIDQVQRRAARWVLHNYTVVATVV